MATEEAPHEGSVTFPLPDGAVLLHALRGRGGPPASSGTVEAELPAKQFGSVAIGVANWLPRRQRFRASVGFDGEPTSVTIKGPDFVDLPASAEREYALAVYAHREGPVAVKVTFTNEETGEYMHYDVVVSVTAPDIIDTLSIRSACRQRAKATVYVDNPLDEPVGVGVRVRRVSGSRGGDGGDSRQISRARRRDVPPRRRRIHRGRDAHAVVRGVGHVPVRASSVVHARGSRTRLAFSVR